VGEDVDGVREVEVVVVVDVTVDGGAGLDTGSAAGVGRDLLPDAIADQENVENEDTDDEPSHGDYLKSCGDRSA